MNERQTARTVLVPLDGSPASAAAMPVAEAIAAQLGAGVAVLHVAAGETSPDDVKTVLGISIEGASAKGASAPDIRIADGDACEAILRVGEDPDIALVVLTTHGHEIQSDGSLRNIPRHVIADSNRPVLVVRPEAACTASDQRPLRRWLVPVDGTPTTTEAFRPAVDIAGPTGAQIDVLFVGYPHQVPPDERGTMTPPQYVDQPHLEWSAWHARVADWLFCHCDNLPRNTVIQSHVVGARSIDDVGKVVADFAVEHQEDAIMIVRRSRLEPQQSPVLLSVLDHTPCPVLIAAGPD
jgi:nucleotide-binding universal stress UspA family protein